MPISVAEDWLAEQGWTLRGLRDELEACRRLSMIKREHRGSFEIPCAVTYLLGRTRMTIDGH